MLHLQNRGRLTSTFARPLRPQDTEDYTDHVSVSQPNQSMSIRELLHRYTTGGVIDESGYKEPRYTNNDYDFDAIDMNEVQGMDMNDRYEMIEALKEHSANLKAQLAQQKAEAESAGSVVVPTTKTPEKPKRKKSTTERIDEEGTTEEGSEVIDE